MPGKLAVAFDRTFGRTSYKVHKFLYRHTRGVIGHRSPQGRMLLLTTTGRKSGQPRTTPLLYMPDGDHYVVVGSNGGRDQPPAWLLNLTADPHAEIQVGRKFMPVTARILTPDEKTAIWPRLLETNPGWAHYQTLTEREMKVVSFEP